MKYTEKQKEILKENNAFSFLGSGKKTRVVVSEFEKSVVIKDGYYIVESKMNKK